MAIGVESGGGDGDLPASSPALRLLQQVRNVITPAIKHIKCHAGLDPASSSNPGFPLPAFAGTSFAGMTTFTYIVAGVITAIWPPWSPGSSKFSGQQRGLDGLFF